MKRGINPDTIQRRAHDLLRELQGKTGMARIAVARSLLSQRDPRRAALLAAAVFERLDRGQQGDLLVTMERMASGKK